MNVGKRLHRWPSLHMEDDPRVSRGYPGGFTVNLVVLLASVGYPLGLLAMAGANALPKDREFVLFVGVACVCVCPRWLLLCLPCS